MEFHAINERIKAPGVLKETLCVQSVKTLLLLLLLPLLWHVAPERGLQQGHTSSGGSGGSGGGGGSGGPGQV